MQCPAFFDLDTLHLGLMRPSLRPCFILHVGKHEMWTVVHEMWTVVEVARYEAMISGPAFSYCLR